MSIHVSYGVGRKEKPNVKRFDWWRKRKDEIYQTIKRVLKRFVKKQMC